MIDDRRKPSQFFRLSAAEPATVDQTRSRIREIYERAYGWPTPHPSSDERLTSTVMRQYVRRWINEWDLRRLYRDYEPHMVVNEFEMDLSEDRDLEVPTEDDAGEPAVE